MEETSMTAESASMKNCICDEGNAWKVFMSQLLFPKHNSASPKMVRHFCMKTEKNKGIGPALQTMRWDRSACLCSTTDRRGSGRFSKNKNTVEAKRLRDSTKLDVCTCSSVPDELCSKACDAHGSIRARSQRDSVHDKSFCLSFDSFISL